MKITREIAERVIDRMAQDPRTTVLGDYQMPALPRSRDFDAYVDALLDALQAECPAGQEPA